MKKIYNLLLVLSLVVLATSCERDQGDTDYLNDRTNTVFFNNTSASLFVEEGGENVVTVSVSSTALAENQIDYWIEVDPSSTAQKGVDYNITSSTSVIEQGTLISTFTITADFSNASLDGKTAVFNLLSDEAAVGADNQFELTLTKSCPYNGLNTTSYSGGVRAFDDDAPSYSTTLNPVAGQDNTWTIASAWGPEFVAWATGDPGFNGRFLYSGTIVINPDYSVTFTGDDAWAIGGTGLFNPCTQIITYTLGQALFTTSFTVDVTLTPN